MRSAWRRATGANTDPGGLAPVTDVNLTGAYLGIPRCLVWPGAQGGHPALWPDEMARRTFVTIQLGTSILE
jgi:hypothetical protein